MGKPTAQDAELILRIYELRREKVLREARAWFASKLEAKTHDELMQKYPPGSQENAYYRMVMGYWDMIGALVYAKTVDEDLFFETNSEFLGVWRKAQTIVVELRQKRNNPSLSENLEYLTRAWQQWQARRQPKLTQQS